MHVTGNETVGHCIACYFVFSFWLYNDRTEWIKAWYYGFEDEQLYIVVDSTMSESEVNDRIERSGFRDVKYNIVGDEPQGTYTASVLQEPEECDTSRSHDHNDNLVTDGYTPSADPDNPPADEAEAEQPPIVRPGSRITIGGSLGFYTATLSGVNRRLGISVGHYPAGVQDVFFISPTGLQQPIGKCITQICWPLSVRDHAEHVDLGFIELNEDVNTSDDTEPPLQMIEFPKTGRPTVRLLNGTTDCRGLLNTSPFTWKDKRLYNAYYVLDMNCRGRINEKGDSGAPIVIMRPQMCDALIPATVTGYVDLKPEDNRAVLGAPPLCESLTVITRIDKTLGIVLGLINGTLQPYIEVIQQYIDRVCSAPQQ